jgi:hypothetical protein
MLDATAAGGPVRQAKGQLSDLPFRGHSAIGEKIDRIGKLAKENVEMSSSSASHWLDRWWPLLVIFFGVLFVSVIVSFHPTN